MFSRKKKMEGLHYCINIKVNGDIVSKVNKLLFFLFLYLVDDTEKGLAKTGRILQKQRRKDITNYNKNELSYRCINKVQQHFFIIITNELPCDFLRVISYCLFILFIIFLTISMIYINIFFFKSTDLS